MNVLKTLTVLASAVAVVSASGDKNDKSGGEAPVMKTRDEQKNDYGKEQAVVDAVTACLKTEKDKDAADCKKPTGGGKPTCLTFGAAKTTCGSLKAVTDAVTAWGKPLKALYGRNPDLQRDIDDIFYGTEKTEDLKDEDIADLIGAVDDSTLTDAADIAQNKRNNAAKVAKFRDEKGKGDWAATVAKCGKDKDAAGVRACATTTMDALCTKTAKTVGTGVDKKTTFGMACCASAECTATDALEAVEQAADDKLSADTKKCSKSANKVTDKEQAKTARKTCFDTADKLYKETTGVDLADAAGKVRRQEKLAKEAKDAVGDAVRGCMGAISTADKADKDKAYAARMNCAGGYDAKTTMADTLGVDVADITTTDAAKYARKGAKDAGTSLMKTFVGKGTKTEIYAQKFKAAKAAMAERGGKTTGGDCDASKSDYLTKRTKDCMTDSQVKAGLDEGAENCMMDAVEACTADQKLKCGPSPSPDCIKATTGECGFKTVKVMVAVSACTGQETTTDAELVKMGQKAKATKIVDAYKAAKKNCADDGLAACLGAAVQKACTAAKGSACGTKELILGKKRGAAKDIAKTNAACLASGGVACAQALQDAYVAVTGKPYNAEGANKLKDRGAKGQVAELMAACTGLASTDADKRACSDPAKHPEGKELYAASKGKAADAITDTEYKVALTKGVEAETGLGLRGCLDLINNGLEGVDRKIEVRKCHGGTAMMAVRAATGKPEKTDMSDFDARYFLKNAAKELTKTDFGACFEAAGADATDKMKCRGGGTEKDATVEQKVKNKAVRDDFKEVCGKPDWTKERTLKEMGDSTIEAATDDYFNCMETKAPKTGKKTAPTAQAINDANKLCQSANKIKFTEFTGEAGVASDIKAQKARKKAAVKKGANFFANFKKDDKKACDDIAHEDCAEGLDALKLITGQGDLSTGEARVFVKKGGQQAATDSMKNCMEDVDYFQDRRRRRLVGEDYAKKCRDESKKKYAASIGKDEVTDQEFIVGLVEGVGEQVADALKACVKSGKTKDSAECKLEKKKAFEATSVVRKKIGKAANCDTDCKTKYTAYEAKYDGQLMRDVAKALKRGVEKSMAESSQACIRLAANDGAKTACKTNEIRDAKIAKAEAEGKEVADITDAKVVQDLEKGKEAEAAIAMESCTEKADTKVKMDACIPAAKELIAQKAGETVGTRRLKAMKKKKIMLRMKKASVKSFGKKMNACIDAAKLKVNDKRRRLGASQADVIEQRKAVTACKTAATAVFKKATAKWTPREGDVDMLSEDAAVTAFMETNFATAESGETYTKAEKKAAVEEAVQKIKGKTDLEGELKGAPAAPGTSVDKIKLPKMGYSALKKKAGAKAMAEKATACVLATATDALAKTACPDGDLMKEDKDATGKAAAISAKKDMWKAKREAAKELVKDKLKACDDCTEDEDDTKVATLLKRGTKLKRDKDTNQAVAELLKDGMKTATGVCTTTAGGADRTADSDCGTAGNAACKTKDNCEKAKAGGTTWTGKKKKMKAELKRLKKLPAETVITDEQLANVLDVGAQSIVEDIADCVADCVADADDEQTRTACKRMCHTEADAALVEALDCKPGAARVKKNQIAKLAAAQAGADLKSADATATKEAIATLMKATFESAGGVKGTFAANEPEITKVKDAFVKDTVIEIKQKPSVDIVVAYPGECEAKDTTVKDALDAADTSMEVVRVGTPTKDPIDLTCKSVYRAKKKTGTATAEELQGISDEYVKKVSRVGRRLSGRRLPAPDGTQVSADQTTEIEVAGAGGGDTPGDKKPDDKKPGDKKPIIPPVLTPSSAEDALTSGEQFVTLGFAVGAITALVSAMML